jgi:hypothetical protein
MRTPTPPVWFFGFLFAMQGLHVIAPDARWLTPPWTLQGIVPVRFRPPLDLTCGGLNSAVLCLSS